MILKKLTAAVALTSLLTLSAPLPARAGGLSPYPLASEFTQLLNNVQLVLQYSQQVQQYLTQAGLFSDWGKRDGIRRRPQPSRSQRCSLITSGRLRRSAGLQPLSCESSSICSAIQSSPFHPQPRKLVFRPRPSPNRLSTCRALGFCERSLAENVTGCLLMSLIFPFSMRGLNPLGDPS